LVTVPQIHLTDVVVDVCVVRVLGKQAGGHTAVAWVVMTTKWICGTVTDVFSASWLLKRVHGGKWQ